MRETVCGRLRQFTICHHRAGLYPPGMSFRKFPLLGLLLVATALVTARASAQPLEGLYGWYEAGATLVDEAELVNFPGVATAGNTVEFDPGFRFGIAIGRKLTKYLKVELESGFLYNGLKSISGATSSSGNLYRVPAMGNVVFQFPNRTRFVPVIGAGAGAQWASFDAQNISFGGPALSESSETWVFTYQGYAGVRYEFREDMSLGVFYHYIVADGPSWEFNNVPGNLKLEDLRTHSLSLTFGWVF
jgi:opacity protein-like surface antigen